MADIYIDTANRTALVLLVILALCGCDQRPLGTEVVVGTAEWNVLHTFDYTRGLTGIWAGEDGTVFTGYARIEADEGHISIYPRGAVYRLEDSEWFDLDFPFSEYSEDLDIWGTSSDNVYVADGNLHRFDGSGWVKEPVPARVISGVSESEIYVATNDTVYRYNGEGWNHLYEFEGYMTPRAIWACEGPSVLVAGYPGIVQYQDGVWTEHDLPIAIYDFVGSGQNDIYAFGIKDYYNPTSAVWHFDGTEWTEAYTIEGQVVRCAWGGSMTDLFTAGDRGVIMHFDGENWSRMQPLTAKTIFDISGNGSGDVFLAGDDQKVLHFDGNEWTSVWMDQPDDCYQIWAESPLCIAVSNERSSVYLLEDGRWRETVIEQLSYIWDLWGTGIDNMLAGSWGGIYRFDGDRWTLETDSLDVGRVLSIHGSGETDIHAVGENLILHYDGTGWVDMTMPGGFILNAVWAIDDRNAFAVGNDGVVMHYDGSGWRLMASGVTGHIRDVWGAASNDVYAVGGCGMIHFDGSRWTRQPVFGGEGLNGIIGWASNDIIAFGYAMPYQLRFDGWNWNPESTDLGTQDFTIAVDGTLLQTVIDREYNRLICEYMR